MWRKKLGFNPPLIKWQQQIYVQPGHNREVVIFTNGHQFRSFEKNHRAQLYVDNGGTYSLDYEQTGDTYIFNMKRYKPPHLRYEKYYIDTLILRVN